MTEPEPSPSGSDPAALETILFACLDAAPTQQEAALAAACAQHPAMAESLRRCWQRIRQLQPSNGLPTQVAGHRILARLGGGGMGVVYLAEQERLHRKVALKLIRSDLLDSPAARERFQREAQAASKVDHPGLCPVFEVGEADGVPFLVMPYLEGRTLAVRLAELAAARGSSASSTRSMSSASRDLVSVVAAVARASHHAHEHGLVHRDIKPGNIMLLTDGRPMLLDFGLARDTTGDEATLTRTGERVGTPAYMAPEQLRGDAAVIDRRTDVYALGIVLYEVALLERPFDGGDMLLLREQVSSGIRPAKLRARVPFDLASIILKAADPEPARRYATAAALADDLEHFLRLEPVSARRLGWTGRVARWVRRHPVVSALLCALVVALGFAGGAAVAATQFALRERAKVHEFNLLSGVVLHEQAVATEKDLCPPWPDRIAAMERWLREDSGQLMAMKTETEGAVQNLRQQALPATEDELKRDRESHPRFAEWQRLGQQLTSLRRAQQIRRGESKFEEREVPPDLLRFDVKLLSMYALARVAPTIKERTVWGEEALGLACARAAAAKAETQDLGACLHTLAWALLANGQDDEAKHQIAAAVDVAPAERKQDFAESYQREIWDAIEQASTNLTRLESEHEALAAAVSGRRTFRLESKAQQLLHNMLVTQLQKLESLQAHEMVRVEQQLQWAKWLRDGLSRQHPKANTTWEAASAAIATADDVVASRLYAGKNIDLGEQHVMGLVPIGMNPKTKLWEFYDLRSAWDGKADPEDIAIPVHDAEGRIAVGADSGIVLVLLPGGTFTMGAQNEDPDGPNYDPAADAGSLAPDSVPTLEVTLAPFFLARHELTQGQWTRLWAWEESLRTPSQWLAGEASAGRKITLANPVEQVDWDMCDRLLRWHGLVLPTEAQWEYGCRAGTTTPWSCSFEVLKDHANVADATLLQVMPKAMLGAEPWNDGYATHAPVGSLAANEFGLFDMHGNVREWCLDLWGGLGRMRWGDGLNLKHDGSGDRAIRGGSCLASTAYVRSGMRYANPTPRRAVDLGVRAARFLRP